MLQLHNHSPFQATIAVFPDVDGVDTLYVVVKSTFEIGEKVKLADEQLPVTMADEYWGEPGQSSLKYATEMHLTKPGTDVALVGEACAKDEKLSSHLDVMLSVGRRTRVVRVFGDRYWMNGMMGMQVSAALPFQRMPLVYENAYGGVHEVEGEQAQVLFEERNPVGAGFLGKRKRKEMDGIKLPNLEDPENLIRYPEDRPSPVGFGFVAPSWEPRKSFAGTYDEGLADDESALPARRFRFEILPRRESRPGLSKLPDRRRADNAVQRIACRAAEIQSARVRFIRDDPGKREERPDCR